MRFRPIGTDTNSFWSSDLQIDSSLIDKGICNTTRRGLLIGNPHKKLTFRSKAFTLASRCEALGKDVSAVVEPAGAILLFNLSLSSVLIFSQLPIP